jgi:cAMP-dependent protein kinase regulator
MTKELDGAALTAIDRAHELRMRGERDAALRLGVALLEGASEQIQAAALVARMLAESGRGLLAGEAAARLCEGFVRRGDYASAVAAAAIAAQAGEDATPLHRRIARAFAKDSPRLADVSPAPPPLPAEGKVPPALEKLRGDALLDRAEAALSRFLAEEDSVPADARLPRLPLVGDLSAASLERLTAALQIRDVPSGEHAVRQGEEGREAFLVVRGTLRVYRTADDGTETVLAALGPGALFGEMALVSESPRAASVQAVEPVVLAVASREVLEQVARKDPALGAQLATFCRGRMVANLLRHSAILGAVAPAERAALMERFETRTFAAGEYLVRRGEETDGLFLVASGSVRVCSEDREGDDVLIATLGPGDVVGEISLVLRRPATADVIAEYPTVALELRRDRFQETIRAHPTLLGELYDLATRREEETRSVVAQEALDASDFVIV